MGTSRVALERSKPLPQGNLHLQGEIVSQTGSTKPWQLTHPASIPRATALNNKTSPILVECAEKSHWFAKFVRFHYTRLVVVGRESCDRKLGIVPLGQSQAGFRHSLVAANIGGANRATHFQGSLHVLSLLLSFSLRQVSGSLSYFNCLL